MANVKTVEMLYGKEGMKLNVPASTVVLEGQQIPPLTESRTAVIKALETPIGCDSLAELIKAKRPTSVAITISDITRPVPNKQFLPAMLEVLNKAGVDDSQIVIIIGTGLHRPSSDGERELLIGQEILNRIETIDHLVADPKTLVQISDHPPISVCRRFAEADFRIVTGYIEPHFMAGFSGGRKGVCPALVDLKTVGRFHGYDTLASPFADNSILEGNPCHEIALKVARTVGVDFLFNVAITRDRDIAGIYCGHLTRAHQAGCRQVGEWNTAYVDEPFDFVVTNGGGFPLDQTFYQSVKGMCTALPALARGSTLLQVSHCREGLGSEAYTELMLRYDNDWHSFIENIKANRGKTDLDQWEYQMQARVLDKIGIENLWFVSDGIPAELQKQISVTAILSDEDAPIRAQRAIDQYMSSNPDARIAAIPEGPYVMLRKRS